MEELVLKTNRYVVAFAGVMFHLMIGSVYAWSVFTNPIAKQKGFLFTPAHYLEPIGVAVFRQTASDPNDFTSSSVYQNPGWKYEASTGAVSVE